MSTNRKPCLRWGMLSLHLGVITFMTACMVFTGVTQSDDGLFRFDDGSIEVRDENGDWVPVDGTSFELVGSLDNIGPWIVAGQELATRGSTMIEDGLEVGELVRVRGIILEDGTWVAFSIEGSEEQTDPIIVLIGVVDSIDPWVVNGIELKVTDETDIQDDITPGMIVRVEILLLEDGTWEVISMAPLGESTETSGCVAVVATVLSVEEDAVLFLGWPSTVPLVMDDEQTEDNENSTGEDGQTEVTITPNQVVLAVLCMSDDGQLIIVNIIILEDMDDNDNSDTTDGEKVLICHKPSKNAHTLSISSSAVPAHLGHGDTLGSCP